MGRFRLSVTSDPVDARLLQLDHDIREAGFA